VERETWRKSTRSNALFLSTAVQLNAEALLPPYRWIDDYLRIVTSPQRVDVETTAKMSSNPATKERLILFLQAFGLPIVDYHIEEKEMSLPANAERVFALEFIQQMKELSGSRVEYAISTIHSSKGGPVEYDLAEESDGTRALFCLSGPLLDTTQEGYTLVVDELHNSLHPLALKFLVDMFHDNDVNSSGAQLVFTSHDTSVMSKGFMHRDQIWLMERNEESGSILTPLSDFDVREIQSFQRAYLGGKYGALPHIGRLYLGSERQAVSEAESDE
jgi:AAA15 family ATPase/GTPase